MARGANQKDLSCIPNGLACAPTSQGMPLLGLQSVFESVWHEGWNELPDDLSVFSRQQQYSLGAVGVAHILFPLEPNPELHSLTRLAGKSLYSSPIIMGIQWKMGGTSPIRFLSCGDRFPLNHDSQIIIFHQPRFHWNSRGPISLSPPSEVAMKFDQ